MCVPLRASVFADGKFSQRGGSRDQSGIFSSRCRTDLHRGCHIMCTYTHAGSVSIGTMSRRTTREERGSFSAKSLLRVSRVRFSVPDVKNERIE